MVEENQLLLLGDLLVWWYLIMICEAKVSGHLVILIDGLRWFSFCYTWCVSWCCFFFLNVQIRVCCILQRQETNGCKNRSVKMLILCLDAFV